MTDTGGETSRSPLRRVGLVLQFVLGVALLVLGVGNLTDTIEWTLPPAAYFAVGIFLLVYGIGMLYRQ